MYGYGYGSVFNRSYGGTVTPVSNIGYIRPHNNTRTSLHDYDAGWRYINAVDTYYPADDSIPALLDPADWYKLVNNNAFGHKTRFTGKTGGYYSYDTTDFRDVSGVATTEALAFPDDYTIDHHTGLGWYRDRLGEGYYEDALTMVNASTLGGYSDWYMPTKKEQESVLNYGSSQTSIWFERQPFIHILPDEGWTGTPYYGSPTDTVWTSESVGNVVGSATYLDDTWDIFITRFHYT